MQFQSQQKSGVILHTGAISDCGPMLETMFQNLLYTPKQYNKIGTYWDRKSENEMKMKILLAEVVTGRFKYRQYGRVQNQPVNFSLSYSFHV